MTPKGARSVANEIRKVRTSSGSVLAYETVGGLGDPLVVIHGGWDDRRDWDRMVEGLAASMQVLAYDRRGHGESSGPPRAQPVADDAADLAFLLEATGHFPAHLLAQAYGGAVGLRLAVDRPELVRSLAIHEISFVELPGAGPRATLVAHALPGLRDRARSDPTAGAREYLERFAAVGEQWPAIGPPLRASLSQYARIWAEEMEDPAAREPSPLDAGSVSVPVLHTSGGLSPLFASEVGDAFVARLTNASSLRLPDVGHFAHRFAPDRWLGVLGTFLLERNVPSM